MAQSENEERVIKAIYAERLYLIAMIESAEDRADRGRKRLAEIDELLAEIEARGGQLHD